MRLNVSLVALLVIAMHGTAAHADLVSFRVDVEVTNEFTGVPLGTPGTVTVVYDDNLPDQLTTGTAHEMRGRYGRPDTPPIIVLWEFGGTNAVYTEEGLIEIVDAPFSFNADSYSASAGDLDPQGISKGAFQSFVFQRGLALQLIDLDDVMIAAETLIPPSAGFLPLAEMNNGDLAFFGPNAFVGHVATGITVLDLATDTRAKFAAGSPAGLLQPIATPTTPFEIAFDVSFDADAVAGGATMEVSLDGTLLDTITANTADAVQPATVDVTDPALADLEAAELVFLFNGPTGSTMTLDNIDIPGSDLLNGDFQTQSLAAWGVSGPGEVTAEVTVIPEPASVTIMLGLMAGVRRPRRRHARA